MQKNLPIIVAVVVVLVIAVVVIASVAGRKGHGMAVPAGVKAAATTSKLAPVKKPPTKEEIKKASALQTALAEAQGLYDAKDYKGALDKCKNILANIDSTSQIAKNLSQMSQIRLIEQRRPAAARP